MPFTNDGPYASFYDNGLIKPHYFVPEGQTKAHIAIECDMDAIFYIEVYGYVNSQYKNFTSSAIYIAYINTATSGLMYLSKLGGSSTLTALNSSGVAPFINGNKAVNMIQYGGTFSDNSLVRITPVKGSVKLLNS